MALVRVSGNAWDHSRKVIPSALQPRLFARPANGDEIVGSLLAGSSSRATLNATSGAFWVDVESDLDYVMWMDWLIPGQAQSDSGDYARTRAEWPVFNSGGGGNIASLFPPRPTGTIVAALGPPPPTASGVVWIDLTDVTSAGALVYTPEGG